MTSDQEMGPTNLSSTKQTSDISTVANQRNDDQGLKEYKRRKLFRGKVPFSTRALLLQSSQFLASAG